MAGAYSLPCFVSPPGNGTAGRPIKKVVDFGKLMLAPGESGEISCNLTTLALTEPIVADQGREARPTVLLGSWRVSLGSIHWVLDVV